MKATDADVCSLVVQMDKLKSSIDDMHVQLSQVVTMKTGSEYKEKAMSKVHEEQNMKKKDKANVKKIADTVISEKGNGRRKYVNNKKILADVITEWDDSEPG